MIGRGAETHQYGFGRDIFGAELLTIPEASVFFDFVRENAEKATNKKTRDLYDGFLPLTNAVVENFITDKLSDNWIAFGGFRPTAYGRYELRAGSDMSEAFLRLKKSELIRDGYLDATLDETAGMFWLYARRSARAMVRFGFDDEGYIRVQTWVNGDLRSYDSRPWLRPPGTVRLRLEMRGDGAVGYVNGKQVFTTPLVVPQEVCYGWWSIAPFAPELGLARARIAHIACGPLCPTILLMHPKMTLGEMSTSLERVRSHVRDMSALAPFAFTQLSDGTIPTEPDVDISAFRMFCTFHRLRLMPVVDLAYYSETLPKFLTDLIIKHRLNGMILRVRTPMDEAWYQKMAQALETTTADLIVIQQEEFFWPEIDTVFSADQEAARLAKLPKVVCREIPRGSLLFHPLRHEWHEPLLSFREWTIALTENRFREGVDPKVVVVPREFQAMAGHTVTQAVVATLIAPLGSAQGKNLVETSTPPSDSVVTRVGKEVDGTTSTLSNLVLRTSDEVKSKNASFSSTNVLKKVDVDFAALSNAIQTVVGETNVVSSAEGVTNLVKNAVTAGASETNTAQEVEKSLWRKVRDRLVPANE